MFMFSWGNRYKKAHYERRSRKDEGEEQEKKVEGSSGLESPDVEVTKRKKDEKCSENGGGTKTVRRGSKDEFVIVPDDDQPSVPWFDIDVKKMFEGKEPKVDSEKIT